MGKKAPAKTGQQKRKAIPPATQRSLRRKSLGVCCVCKERGIGTNFHHIDGNPSNNDDENIDVLCVKEHDQHHRPKAYDDTKHLELGSDKIRAYKLDWENAVKECRSDNPQVLTVVCAFGTEKEISSAKFSLQNIDGKIIYERLYHRHFGDMNDWTDWIMDELMWLGRNVKLHLINQPQAIELCPCGCKNSLSTIIDKNVAIQSTAKDWKHKSIGTIYINPTYPSFTITIFYGETLLYTAHLHKCGRKYFNFHCDKFDEKISIKKNTRVKKQAETIMKTVMETWNPGLIFIGTGNPEKPKLIKKMKLPDIWEG